MSILRFDVSITFRNGDSFTDKILFDSGAGLTLLINKPFSERHQLKEKAGKSLITRNHSLTKESIQKEVTI